MIEHECIFFFDGEPTALKRGFRHPESGVGGDGRGGRQRCSCSRDHFAAAPSAAAFPSPGGGSHHQQWLPGGGSHHQQWQPTTALAAEPATKEPLDGAEHVCTAAAVVGATAEQV
jgi:hypothetical protein